MRLTVDELEERWLGYDRARGERPSQPRVERVCVRPALDERAFPDVLELCPRRGAIGDRWERRTWMYLADGSPDPRVQVALMDARILAFLQETTGCRHHPGDTLLADIDLHENLVPIGTRLRVGEAVIEVSDVENDGCAKFAAHYGAEVLSWIRLPANRVRRLRGVFARVIEAGRVRAGDAAERVAIRTIV
ncbi:hypothetical protein ASA1KI_08420 [Opitutales bacterium ASA1]|uniref:MOSC domain-containing protein n=1 Tax=Congregicoccus parvus TaxID=3081749 RepID=UPI002B2A734B|nr:hypothetical protein ASA1KI_08420 [Opitutales bacterium ASA1]